MELNKVFVFVNNKPENQSGGNIYNNQISESLRKLGCTVFQTKDIYDKNFIQDKYIVILDSIIIDENLDLEFYKNQNAYFLIHLWTSCNKDLDPRKRTLLIEKQKEICEKFPLIFAGEHSMNQCVEFYDGKLQNHFIIPPAVQSGWKKKQEHPATATNFLVIGNLCKRKRQLELVKLFSSFNYSINLTLIGRIDDKDYGEKILQEIDNCGNTIVLHPEVAFYQMNDLILNFDAVISFSEEENNSIGLLESIASGIPIITTPTGNYLAYKNQEIGCVLDGFELKDLSEAIIKIHTDASFYEQQCNSVINFRVNGWDESAALFSQL